MAGKSMGGVLFLDEIDKTDDDRVRSMLLRLLEQDSYVIPKTNQLVKLDPAPLYIFAGSKPVGEMYSLGPTDFWTRISHVIELQHPLDSDDLETRRRVCKDYFEFFWLQHIPKFFEDEKLISKSDYVDPTVKLIHEYCTGPFKLLIDKRTVENLSEIFAEEIGLEAGPPPSIRNIRSLARRIAFEMVELVLYDKDPETSWKNARAISGDKDVFEQLKDRFPQKHLGIRKVTYSQAIFEKILRRIIAKSISGIT